MCNNNMEDFGRDSHISLICNCKIPFSLLDYGTMWISVNERMFVFGTI